MSSEKTKEFFTGETTEELVNKMMKGSKFRSHKEESTTANNNVNIDDVDFSKLDSNTKKTYTDLFSGMIDIYGIIGVSKDDSDEVIRSKCNKKIAIYHPDKHAILLAKVPESQREKEKKKLDTIYKLVKDASNILRNPEKRKYYDLQKKTIESKNFVKQKNDFEEFKKLQDSEISEQSKKNASNNFKIGFLDLDKKHNFDRRKLDDDPLDSAEIKRRLDELTQEREQQELNYAPKNIFEGKNFTNADFNKAWEKMTKKKDKINKNKNTNYDGSLVSWDGILAANDTGLAGSNEFVSINSNYEDLYDTNNYNSSNFASKLNDDDEIIDFSSDDSLGEHIDVSYVTGHNSLSSKEETMARFNDIEKKRKQEDEDYENRKFGDNKVWGSVLENPLNISAQMGKMVGQDLKSLAFSGSSVKPRKTINKDMIDAYKQLVYDEKTKKTKEKKTSS